MADAPGYLAGYLNGLSLGSVERDENSRSLRRMVPARLGVATRVGALGGDYTALYRSDGSGTAATYRSKHYVAGALQASEIQVEFANWNLRSQGSDGTTGEFAGDNDITVRASLEYNGVSYPLFFGGKRSVVIEPGASVASEICGVTLPAGAFFWIRTFVSVAAAGRWPFGRTALATGEGTNFVTAEASADLTNSVGNIPSATLGSMYGPSNIYGRSENIGGKCVLVIGDSISIGVGDGAGDANGYRGFAQRALASNVPHLMAAQNGYRLKNFNDNHSRTFGALAPRVTSAIFELGTNDLFSTALPNFATLQAAYLAAVTELVKRGIPVWAVTVGPATTSTDGWATPGNQTTQVNFREADRILLNDWLRTVPAPLSGVIDTADVDETARNSGKWKAGATNDGLHRNSTYAALAAAVVPVADFV